MNSIYPFLNSRWLTTLLFMIVPFLIFAQAPVIHTIEPSSGFSETIVAIEGEHFAEDLKIFFGETPVKWFYRKTSQMVYVYAPESQVKGPTNVTVHTSQGISETHRQNVFTYTD